MTKIEQIKSLEAKLERLRDVSFDDLVITAIERAREKRKPKIDEIREQIRVLRESLPQRKPIERIPENCPAPVKDACDRFWKGSSEYDKYIIKAWNDKAVVVVGGEKGYSNNSGWNYCSPHYYILSLTETNPRHWNNDSPKILKEIETSKTNKATPKKIQEWLKEATTSSC